MRCAVVNLNTNLVVNVIDYDVRPTGVPPGMTGNLIAVQSSVAGPGWIWNPNTLTLTAPALPAPDPLTPQQQLYLSYYADANYQDLVNQLRGATPTQVATYVNNNVTDLASAKVLLVKIIVLLGRMLN